MFRQTITAADMRSINQSAILELIRRESPISRTEISQRLHLSLPTVMRIVDELIAEDLVRAQDETQWSGGRPRALLEFNTHGYIVIGVDLGGTKIYGAATQLDGTVLSETHVAHHATTGEDSYQTLAQVIDHLLNDPNVSGRRVRGIGVGAPGVTLPDEGIVTWAPSLNWRDFPLKARLSSRFEYPIIVDNDLNLAAQGEYWFGAGTEARDMVLIAIGTGIGAGIILDGALHRGRHQASGEVGYLLPGRAFLRRRYEGFGALEGLASGTGIAARAREALTGQRPQAQLDTLTAEDVFDAYRAGEPWAQPVIDETIDYLAMMVGATNALLDPDVIVFGGGVAKAGDLLLPLIEAALDGALPVPPKLVVSTLGPRATVLGTITSVLQYTTESYAVRKLS